MKIPAIFDDNSKTTFCSEPLFGNRTTDVYFNRNTLSFEDVCLYFISATASYRLLPEITLTREVTGSEATLLQSCFSPCVIGIDSDGRAFVRDARYDSCSRNVYRYDCIKDAVVLSRIRDHFICEF